MDDEISTYTLTLDEQQIHALQIAVADQLHIFGQISLDPSVDGETLKMTFDLIDRYASCVEALDVENLNLVKGWHEAYELMKKDAEELIEDSEADVIQMKEWSKERKNNGVIDEPDETS